MIFVKIADIFLIKSIPYSYRSSITCNSICSLQSLTLQVMLICAWNPWMVYILQLCIPYIDSKVIRSKGIKLDSHMSHPLITCVDPISVSSRIRHKTPSKGCPPYIKKLHPRYKKVQNFVITIGLYSEKGLVHYFFFL